MVTHSSILAWEIPWIRGAWWAIVHGVTKSQTRLSRKHFHNMYRVFITCQIPYILSSWVLTTTLGDTISILQKRTMRLGRGRVVKLPKFVCCGIWILASLTLESSTSLLCWPSPSCNPWGLFCPCFSKSPVVPFLSGANNVLPWIQKKKRTFLSFFLGCLKWKTNTTCWHADIHCIKVKCWWCKGYLC